MTTRPRSGMTLMELLVAIAITGLMTAAGVGTFAAVIDHRTSLTASTVGVERAVALREQIDDWISSGTVAIQQGGGPRGRSSAASVSSVRASGPMGSMASGAAASAAVSDPDAELTVTTNALTPTLAPSARVRLYIDTDDNTPETGLAVEIQASQQTPLVRRELDSAVTGMLVEFLDQRTHRWVSASQGATISPMAVRITLSGSDDPSRDPLPGVLRLPIVRATTDLAAQRNGVP